MTSPVAAGSGTRCRAAGRHGPVQHLEDLLGRAIPSALAWYSAAELAQR